MCKILAISRSGYYKYRDKDFSKHKDEHTDLVVKIFNDNNQIYGARKIKKACEEQGVILSRRSIGHIMAEEGLVSRYTVAQFKPKLNNVNREQTENIVNQEFNDRCKKEVIVSDLTYVRVGNGRNYVCVIVDLFNREIIAYTISDKQDLECVLDRLNKLPNISEHCILHRDWIRSQ